MEAVLFGYGESQTGRHVIDACREVGHLQRTICQLGATELFQHVAQQTVGDRQGKRSIGENGRQHIEVLIHFLSHEAEGISSVLSRIIRMLSS